MSGAITVTVLATKGSAPRDGGTTMQVTQTGQTGTIGGGALEWEATRIAREMLATGADTKQRVMPLGPELGQCCGGSVTLEFSTKPPEPARAAPPLWVWGAGHVGRAIATVMAPFEDRAITLVDIASTKMPDSLPHNVSPLVATDPLRALAHAPRDADHLILTYSHTLDLALCDALLRRDFASVGLIGSATKWARFRKRLSAMGHTDAQISRITCPIGDPGLGKHPQAIALGVASALIFERRTNALGERAG